MHDVDYLALRLDAPLMSFGETAVDNRFPTAEFPSPSMLSGLIGNAVGLKAGEDAFVLQGIQDRLRYAVRLDRFESGSVLTDFQTARLSKSDAGWTTFGEPEERSGDDRTYLSPQLRWREYVSDVELTVAFRFAGVAASPGLRSVESALRKPARPLFIGRKSCPPASRILLGRVTASSAVDALTKIPISKWSWSESLRFIWQNGEEHESVPELNRFHANGRLRDWRAGVHAGEAVFSEGEIRKGELNGD